MLVLREAKWLFGTGGRRCRLSMELRTDPLQYMLAVNAASITGSTMDPGRSTPPIAEIESHSQRLPKYTNVARDCPSRPGSRPRTLSQTPARSLLTRNCIGPGCARHAIDGALVYPVKTIGMGGGSPLEPDACRRASTLCGVPAFTRHSLRPAPPWISWPKCPCSCAFRRESATAARQRTPSGV